ncbi:MAG: hypothetical protein U0271_04145 [Polyangiaceae bacterium]
MTIEETCSWLDEAVRDLELLPTLAGGGVGRRLGAAVARLARMNGGAGLRDAFTRPGTTPFVRLVDAAARDLRLTGDNRVSLIGRSTALLYLYVRLQDDLVDEETVVDRASVFAMEFVLAHHLTMLSQAGLSERAFGVRGEVMASFARVAADEVDLRERGLCLPAERLGDKFLPMAVPLVALASAAGREDLTESLVDWVRAIGGALQQVNDVLNAAEDRALGRPTALLSAVAPEVRALEGNALRAGLLADPATRAALESARHATEEARTRAMSLGLGELAQLAGGVTYNIVRTEERLLAIMLGAPV